MHLDGFQGFMGLVEVETRLLRSTYHALPFQTVPEIPRTYSTESYSRSVEPRSQTTVYLPTYFVSNAIAIL